MAIISNATTIADAGAFSVSLGAMTLIKTVTASSSATVNFVHGASSVVLNDTYPIYVFKLTDIHVANNDAHFTVNFSIDSGSNYNVTKTTAYFRAQGAENGSGSNVSYNDLDQAQGTGYTGLSDSLMNANDASSSGEMYLFNPSSTTFVKHFIARTNVYLAHNVSQTQYVAGYCNVTAAIDGVKFEFTSGNIETGIIKLYGIKDS